MHLARLFKIKFRALALCAAIALIAGLAVPAWQRARFAITLQRARTALRQREFQAALGQLTALNRSTPKHKEICYLLGVVSRRLAQFDQAFRFLQQAEDLGFPLKDITRQRYLARFQAGDIEGTQRYLIQLVNEGADDDVAEEIYEALADGYLKQVRVVDAYLVLDHWLEWQPHATQPRFLRAQLIELLDEDWDTAIAHYRKVIEVDPTHFEAHHALAEALQASHKVEEARREYLEIRRRFPDKVTACLGLAQCERSLGNNAEAQRQLEQLLKADVEEARHGWAWSELGQLALGTSDYERAAKCFETALQKSPNDVQTHHLLGTVYSRLGRKEEALQHLQRARRDLEKHAIMKDLSNEVAKHPKDIKPRVEMAKLLLELGKEEDAIAWLTTIVNLDSTNAYARATLAELFQRRGLTEVATAHRQFVPRPVRDGAIPRPPE